MKKIVILILFLVLPLVLRAQLSGLGTFASPYSGTFQGNLQWNSGNFSSGKVYIGGDVTIDNEQLIIGTGMKIVFVTAGADLIINGTGRMNAIGTSGSGMITFTADFNDNSVYGETGERWGHIVFDNPSGSNQSTLDYCIIEYGDVSSGSNTTSYGGGIYSNIYSNLIISNSTIRFNKSSHGGGILAFSGASPTLSNTLISENTATTGGGGIYLHTNCTSTITNCIINNNVAGTGLGGGGGIFLHGCSNVRVINSDIVNNSTLRTDGGYNIQYYLITDATNRPRFINCIAWGNDNSIAHISCSPVSTDFVNCAIRDVSTPASTYTTCIDLSSSNELGGPNFLDPILAGGVDWSIKFVSPCRDAGTSTGAPATDYLGKNRIGPYDIGAYEVQYSRWNGATSTTWTTQSNWESSVDPASGSGDVVIPFISGSTPNYPGGAPNFIIGTGKTMILRPGAQATMGSLTNSGTLRLEEDVTGISSLIFDTYSGNPADIQLYLSGGGGLGTYQWHYISSPVTALPVSVFSGTTLNVAKYYENLITTDQTIGWVAYDGWIYLPVGHYGGGPTFTDLDVGKGYNYYFSSPHTYTFSGVFNTSDITIGLTYNSAGSPTAFPDTQGFNLLGNPFPSCLDWSQISGTLDGSISKAIYFNKGGSFASWVNGIGTNGGTGTIPPMQGFFVKAYSVGKSVTLPASARVHNFAQTRYKKGLEIIPLVRLKIEDQLNSDDAVVRFDEKATTAVDNDFDAYKFSKTGSSVDIWTTTGGTDLSINGLPFPNPDVEIPVSIYSSVAGNLKISGSQIDGLENYSVSLTDNVNNITIDLKKTANLSFNAPGGIVAGRFVLKIFTIATAVPETTVSDKSFNVYSSKGTVNIQTLGDTWNGKSGGIKVLDMTGRIVTTEDNVVFSKYDLHQITVRAGNGIYIVEIRSGVMRYVGKVVVR